MTRALRKDRSAETDLVEIWVYTFETWGEPQADRYLALLEQGILQLASAPELGSSRASLRPGYWSKRVQHHVVFYTFTDNELRIRRVLHEAMDLERHL